MADRLRRTGGLDVSGPVQAYEAVAAVGESTEAAYLDAMAWVVKHPGS
jgi:hypothetical protein